MEQILNLIEDALFKSNLLSDGFTNFVIVPKLQELINLIQENLKEE